MFWLWAAIAVSIQKVRYFLNKIEHGIIYKEKARGLDEIYTDQFVK